MGHAYHSLGDSQTARLEFDAARRVFQQVGAAPDVARLRAVLPMAAGALTQGLTPRERQVLSLVAVGKSNRMIAAQLVASEHTVARHLQNIFTKLGLSSRTAVAAYAYQHGLVEPPNG